MRRFLLFLIILALSFSFAFSQNTRYVAVESLAVRDSAGFFGREVGTLSLGASVTVVRDDGRFIQIRAGNLSGWVASSGLSTRRVIAAGSAVTPSEVALAGKGFSREVETAYRNDGLDFSMVDAMERIVIPAAELQRFINEGRLAGGR